MPKSCRKEALASSVGLWVSDQMLQQAVHRFQRRAFATSRHLCRYIGPLESRRRNGKRNMTGSMPQIQPERQALYFQALADLSSWEWKPPTTSRLRQEARQRWTISNLLESLIEWLEGPEAAKPFISPPADALSEQDAAVSVSSAGAASDFVIREIADLQATVLANLPPEDVATDRALYETCGPHLDALAGWFAQRHVSMPDLVFAMRPLDGQCMTQMPPAASHAIISYVHMAIFKGLELAQAVTPRTTMQDLWAAALHILRTDPDYGVNQNSLVKLLQCMGLEFRDEASIESLTFLTRHCLVRLARPGDDGESRRRKHAKLSSSLGYLNEVQRRTLLSSVDTFVRTRAESGDWDLCFSWLLYRARDDQDTLEQFLGRIQEVTHILPEAINLTKLWLLLVARLPFGQTKDRIGVFETRTMWIGVLDTRRLWEAGAATRWEVLYHALRTTPNCQAFLHETTRCLAQLGQLSKVASMLANFQRKGRRQKAVRALAASCPDAKTAVQVFSVLEYIGNKKRARGVFGWEAWIAHAKELVQDPKLSPETFKVIKFGTRDGSSDAAEGEAQGQLRLRLIHDIAISALTADELTDRQKIRRVRRCVNLLRHLEGGTTAPSFTLAALSVFLDLETGGLGCFERLNWLTEKLLDVHGKDSVAEELVKNLHRWRNANARKQFEGEVERQEERVEVRRASREARHPCFARRCS